MKRNGFTLAEVLISIGVFAIGMIAVASLFPVGAQLQKQTADDILGEQSATNMEHTIRGIGLTYRDGDPDTDLGRYYDATTAVYGPSADDREHGWIVMADDLDVAGSTFYNRFPLESRSFPTTEEFWNDRDHFCFVFVQDTARSPAVPAWVVTVMVVERKSGQDYAAVRAGLQFGIPTKSGSQFVSVTGNSGEWSTLNPPNIAYPASGFVYYHDNAVAVESFVVDTQ